MIKNLSEFAALSTLGTIVLSIRGILVLNHLDDILLGHLVVYQVVSMMFIYSSFGLLNGTFRYYVKKPDRIGYSNMTLIALLLIVQLPLIALILFYLKVAFLPFLLIMGTLSYIQNMIENTLLSQSKFRSHGTISVISSLISLIGVFLTGDNNLELVFFAFALHPLIYTCTAILMYPGIIRYSFVTKGVDLKSLFVEGWPLAVISILVFMANQGDKLIFNAFYGEEILGKYYIVFVTLNLVVLLPRILTQYFLPSIIKEKSKEYFTQRLRWNIYMIAIYSFLILISIVGVKQLDYQPFTDRRIDYHLLLYSSPLFVLASFQFIPSMYWHFLGYLKSMMWVSMLALLVYLLSLFVLLGRGDFFFVVSKNIYFAVLLFINIVSIYFLKNENR